MRALCLTHLITFVTLQDNGGTRSLAVYKGNMALLRRAAFLQRWAYEHPVCE